jgi:hypothetical protein
MSLQPQAVPPIPEETARVARAAFPKGNYETSTILGSHEMRNEIQVVKLAMRYAGSFGRSR